MKILKVISIILFIGIVLFGITFSIPVEYEVKAFIPRKGAEYWQLEEGVSIGYTKVETKNLEKKEPIIYLHGGPGGKITDEVIDALKPLSQEGHDLYFYDQIGSGHSTRLEDIAQYSVDRHREDLRKIIGLIGAEKVTLIGQSWGACLAINYLQEYSSSINKIILTGPGPILPINKALRNEIPPDSLNLFEPEFSNREGNEKVYNWRSKTILRWAYIFNSKLVDDKEADDFFTYLNGELSKSTFCKSDQAKKYTGGGGYYSHIMTAKSFSEVEDKREKLSEIQVPILILRGQCDNQKWGFAKEYLDLLPNSHLEVIANTGHNLAGGNRGKYYELINEFIMSPAENKSYIQ